MNDLTNMETGWEQCPAGEISSMVGRIKGRRRKMFAVQLAGGATFGISTFCNHALIKPR